MVGHIKNFKCVGFLGIILLAFGVNAYSGELYVIAEDDTVFVGSDFEYYDQSSHELGLTEAGITRWSARMQSENYEGRAIAKLSKLTGREFVLEVDGEVVSVGHFSSAVSSRLYPGLVIWDSLISPEDKSVHLGFALHGTDGNMSDPRESEKLLNFFRSREQLVDSVRER